MIAPETLTILSQLAGQKLSPAEAGDLLVELNNTYVFAPNAIVASLVEKLQLRYNALGESDEITPVFADILARDKHTGYYIHSALRHLYLDVAATRAKMPGQADRNFLILGDFLNLSNVNDAIGRGPTNDMMATICGVFVHAMTRAGVVNWLFHRSMGDEITFIVIDTDSARVTAALEEAERETHEFVQSLGLERLRHKKYPRQQGTGLVVALTDLAHATDHKNLKLQLDETIKQKKRLKRKPNWFGFARSGVDPDQFHNRTSEQRIDKALAKYKHFRIGAQQIEEHNNALPRNPLTPAQTLLVGRAIAWPRDDRIEYLRSHHNNSKIMLRADIYNLGGLNAVFGHDGADHIKAHLIRILYTTITAHYTEASEPKIFDCGGGIIDIVIDTLPDVHLHKLIETLQNNIHHQILSLSVSGYANAYSLSHSGDGTELLAELAHPRQENIGTGLVMATHRVETARSLPEIIERLDKITHRTKMHSLAYLWADEENRVFAFKLNEFPEPILIGKDRDAQTLHYLPFTDALREAMKQEDLPIIFERPVGQICETLFGTDMQAVLGFKKAIRMLQEKEINDHKIETIDSYEAMNKKLLAEGLPPLSVVSTQNRPAFVQNDREAFRTMALAEKLEDLPRTMTSLILQAQSAFRTLKITQPHGHLPSAQAIQVLQEELARFKLPKLDPFNPGEQFSESLYALVRLIDFTCAVLDKEIATPVRQALQGFSFILLQNLAHAFDEVSEDFLAKKFREYITAHQTKYNAPAILLQELENYIELLLTKIEKKNLLEEAETQQLKNYLLALTNTLRLHSENNHLKV